MIDMRSNLNENQNKMVNVPISLFESIKGRYFVGQSGVLEVNKGLNAWAGLFNPQSSSVNLFVNVFTITNYSQIPVLAEIWFNPAPLEQGKISNKVTPANVSLTPLPKTKIKLISKDAVSNRPKAGVNPFKRISPPSSTIETEQDGKFIFPPGGSFVLFLTAQEKANVQIAFGWWEEPICLRNLT